MWFRYYSLSRPFFSRLTPLCCPLFDSELCSFSISGRSGVAGMKGSGVMSAECKKEIKQKEESEHHPLLPTDVLV